MRRATAEDQALIRDMVIREAELDPTDLHWSHFVIAELDGEVAGIGQIRPHPGCPELGSIYTRPRFEGRGIGGAVIGRLVEEWPHPGPIYLECQSHNATYYQRFGFREIPWYKTPFPLKLKAGAGKLLGGLFRIQVSTMILERDTHDTAE